MDELIRAGVIRVGDELKYQSKDNIDCTVMVSSLPNDKACSACPQFVSHVLIL